jgi:hypothetical protein
MVKLMYLIACCLFLAAIASNWSAERHYATAAITTAKSTKLDEFERNAAMHRPNAEIQIGARLGIAGLFAACLGVVAWVGSFTIGRRRGKRITPVIPLILCCTYLMQLLKMA